MSQATVAISPGKSYQTGGMRPGLSRVVFWLSGLFLGFLVLQAPLRYWLALVHLDALIYLPKLLLLAAVMLFPLLRPRASAPALMVSLLAGVYLLWGIVNLPSPAQAAFGLWVLVPLLFGLWAGAVVNVEQWQRMIFVLFVMAAVGVLLNPLIHYPWSGQAMDILGKDIEISRSWTALGIQRYSGFARASFSAASQLLLFSIILVVLMKRRAAKLMVWIVAGVAIALTTTKGTLGAWLLVSLYFAGGALLRWPRYWIQIWLGILSLILLLMVTIPISTILFHYDTTIHGFATKFLFASFGDRLDWMWPDSLHLLNLGGSWHWWVGRGLGGIGAAQQYFEPARFLAADNLFVYTTVWLGLPLSLILFSALWWRIVRLCLQHNAVGWRLPMLLALVAYGVVVNEIEGSVLAFFLGLSLTIPNLNSGQISGLNCAQ